MKRVSQLATFLVALGAPFFAAAQTGINTAYIKSYSDSIIYIINSILVPLLIALSFIVFLYGVYRYFIQGAASDSDRETGRQFALWGVIGFVIIVSLWGIVNLFTSTLGLTARNVPGFPVFSTGTYAPPSGAPGGTYVSGGAGTPIGGGSGGGGSTLGGGGGMTPAQSAALTSLQGQYANCLSSGSPYSALCTSYKTALETYNAAFSNAANSGNGASSASTPPVLSCPAGCFQAGSECVSDADGFTLCTSNDSSTLSCPAGCFQAGSECVSDADGFTLCTSNDSSNGGSTSCPPGPDGETYTLQNGQCVQDAAAGSSDSDTLLPSGAACSNSAQCASNDCPIDTFTCS
ncbi:MAG: pilin [Candidatus Pacebacteria bacterium]|nr:pilin [Candidatus Paceibacterota bacterium]